MSALRLLSEPLSAHAAADDRPDTAQDMAQDMADVCRTLIRCNPDCVVVLNALGEIELINDSGVEQLGVADAAGVIGQAWIALWPADQRVVVDDALRRARLGEIARFAAQRPGPADRTQWWDVVASLVDQETGVPRGGVICIARDITDLKVAQEKTARALRLEALGQITSGVAHDFNNLLTIIMGAAETLAETLDSKPDDQDLALVCLRAAEQGADQIRRLLAFARPQPLDLQIIDGGMMLDNIQMMASHLLADNVDLTVSRAHAPLPCRVDRAELEAALLNLCLNSRDAMPHGGALAIAAGAVSLDEAAARPLGLPPGDYVTFTVRDNGVGMSPETLRRAVEPFFTTKIGRGGSGLGLSSMHSFAERSGGHLTIASAVGRGTTVQLFIPRASEERQGAASTDLYANGRSA